MKKKSHKGIKSRFKLTCLGKFLFKKRGFSHLLRKKSTNRKRRSKKPLQLFANKLKFKYSSLI